MTTLDEKALEIAESIPLNFGADKTLIPAQRRLIQTLIIAALKSELKNQRREIGERIKASDLPNKDEVTAVVFPSSTPPVEKKWVDLSKDAK